MRLTETWSRNSFDVECVQVTKENIQDVKKWCQGLIKYTSSGAPYIRLLVIPNTKSTPANAHIGDWILFVGGRFKHYRDSAFKQAYSKKSDLRAGVFALMQKALSVDLETCQISWSDLAGNYTNEVMKLLEGE